jgi:hypothetical protein
MCNHTAQASAHHTCTEDGDLKRPHWPNIGGDIWSDRWLDSGRTWGWRGCDMCAEVKKLGKMRLNSMDHGSRRRHTAAMGPHPRQQSTQQTTNNICDGSTSLKLEKKYLLLVIRLLMHIVSMITCNNDDAVTWWWAPCSLLDDIAGGNGTLPLPTISLTRGDGGGEGRRGL